MTKKELIKAMEHFNEDHVVIVMDDCEGWDNICGVKEAGSQIAIFFGGGFPFSDE
jgi:hypothetical protein